MVEHIVNCDGEVLFIFPCWIYVLSSERAKTADRSLLDQFSKENGKFFTYINDMPYALKCSNIMMYADNTSLAYSAKNVDNRSKIMNYELENLKNGSIVISCH